MPTAAVISHPPTPPVGPFPPTDPPIALQSITRDAPLSQAAMASLHCPKAVPIVHPSLLVRPSSG